MACQNLAQLVTEKYYALRALRGCTDPEAIARLFAGQNNAELRLKIFKIVQRIPTKNFIFPHAETLVRTLYDQGDSITIWTQGLAGLPLWRFATSGLSQIRNTQPSEKKRLSVIVARDKITALLTLLRQWAEASTQNTVIFVDNKKRHLLAAKALFETLVAGEKWAQAVQVFFVHFDRAADQSTDFDADHFCCIKNISEVVKLREKIVNPSIPLRWLIDLGDTLLDSKAIQEAICTSLTQLIESSPCVISPFIDTLLDLRGNVIESKKLEVGSRAREAFLLTMQDGQSKVIKHNNKERVLREAQGYDVLAHTPLGKFMPYPSFVDIQHGVMILPRVEGIPLRQGVKEETLPMEMTSKIFEEVLQLKQGWWASQMKRHSLEVLSVQRYDWPDTLKNLFIALEACAKSLQLSLADFLNLPIVLSSDPDTKNFPTINEMIKAVSQLLERAPDYTVLTHGDLTGANLLIDPVNGKWHAIDPEFSGYGDPAESYVKLVKYRTTATAQKVNRSSIQYLNARLEIDVDVVFSPLAIKLNQMGLTYLQDFRNALSDDQFTQRFKRYLLGSYLREIALTIRRNRPDMLLFALSSAVEIFK